MHKHHLSYNGASEPFNYQVSKTKNPLGIVEVNFIWDQHKKHLNIIMKSDRGFKNELSASINGNSLVLTEPQTGIGMEVEPMKFLFSDVELKIGYEYDIISSEIIDPSLFKVTLAYKSVMNNRYH